MVGVELFALISVAVGVPADVDGPSPEAGAPASDESGDHDEPSAWETPEAGWLDALPDPSEEEDPFAHLEEGRVGSWQVEPDDKASPRAPSTTASPDPGQALHESGGVLGWGLVLGLKGGGGRADASNEGLGWSLVGELELGYSPPLPEPLGRDLGVFLSAAYAAPSLEGEGPNDPRLGGDGGWRYRLTVHQAITTVGVIYRVPIPLSWVRPYASLGARGYGTWTVVEGAAEERGFGPSTEARFHPGAFGAAGADFIVGPGAILAELQGGFYLADGRVLRSPHGAWTLVAGYRFLL